MNLRMIPVCLWLVMVLGWHMRTAEGGFGYADPISPVFDHSDFQRNGLYVGPLMSASPTVKQMVDGKMVGYGEDVCLSHADSATDIVNQNFNYGSRIEMPFNWDPQGCGYLWNTTYWLNEYMHIGHVWYDIVLMQLLATTKIDRVIVQRIVCHSNICAGLGSIDSFYKGYFAAIFAAFDQPNVPVYLRFAAQHGVVEPLYFSVHSPNYYNETAKEQLKSIHAPQIQLKKLMCFQKVFRRSGLRNYGATPTVSAWAVQRFKKTVYNMLRPPLLEHFTATREGPFRILLGYRGPQATRSIANIDEFIGTLSAAFPPPMYSFSALNTSRVLTFAEQARAVGEAHVVIANHGAFEGNMIYMKNSSMLVEIFGHYGNNEVHSFHRLALMFGIYYARVHPYSLHDHQLKQYVINATETRQVVDVVHSYFLEEAYRFNTR